jgi:hypothetical protein
MSAIYIARPPAEVYELASAPILEAEDYEPDARHSGTICAV